LRVTEDHTFTIVVLLASLCCHRFIGRVLVRYPRSISHQLRISLLLGCAALVSNLIGYSAFGSLPWPEIGNVFVFIAVGSMGPIGALVSSLVTASGSLLFFPEHTQELRLIFLAVGSSLLMRAFPRMQLFAAVGLLWLIALLPTASSSGWNPGWEFESVMVMGLWDVLLAVVAGLALVNPVVWGAITNKPRRAELTTVLSHGIAGAALFPLIGAVTIFGLEALATIPHATSAVVTLSAFSLMMSLWLSERLSLLIQSQETSLLPAGGPRRFRSISQFASEMWKGRRQLWNQDSGRSVDGADMTRSRAVLASSQGRDAGICALTRGGSVAFVNEKFREMAGIQHNDILGKRFESIPMKRRFMEAATKIVEESFEKGMGRSSELRLNQFPDQLRFFKLTTELPDTRATSDAQNIIITAEDITSRRTLGFEVIVEQRRESLSALVSGLSHALNNSLTSISGYAGSARHLSDPEALGKALDSIVSATKDAGNIVRQLLDFADLRSCSPKPEQLEQVLGMHRDLMSKAAGEAYEVAIDLSPSPCPVSCDSGLVLQAVTNLVLRAKDSYPAGRGRIWISLGTETFGDEALHLLPGARVGTYARVQVRDEGAGMARETLRQLLDPAKTQSPEGERVGLRLATAYAIVLAHDGFLIADSMPDKGTTVSLYFPLLSDAALQIETDTLPAPAPAEGAQSTPRSQEHILVVEDDENIRAVVSSMLSTMGYEVVTCSSGDEALKECADRRFDLVLVDLVMPRMHGLEVLERIRGQYPHMKTLLMTGSGHVPPIKAERQQVIPKPFDMETLASAIKSSLS
jgi:two-component system cell cycle sensor histidine kinase/response regulator CckA